MRTPMVYSVFAILLSLGMPASAQQQVDPVISAETEEAVAEPIVTPEIQAMAADAIRRLQNTDSKAFQRALAAKQGWASEERQSAMRAHEARLRGTLGLTEGEAEGTSSEKRKTVDNEPALVIFISSSVPISTLRAYAAQLERIGGVMVMRGVPGPQGVSALKPFISFSADILKRDPLCEGYDCEQFGTAVLLDPVLFRAAGVEAVPASAIVDGELFASYCERGEEASPAISSLIYGDAHVTGHLEAHGRAGNVTASTLLSHYTDGVNQ